MIQVSAAGDWIRVRYGSFFKSNLTIAPKLNFGDSFRNKNLSHKNEKRIAKAFCHSREGRNPGEQGIGSIG
ncbi:hypothetical protein Dform_00024 [Dehalogenimonas formicexedens]|uniref:Uncharacterized protein n=1 Tax=Dehalogenimonas formicexedens TaxID=1839801 RepID=A0A1P8F4M9_9CHLR|nr:hypothetical protein [Dehalogenimonas formicexedens]APV43390.1 hypothetical protein Dform_00024 [Dehalogenimonas formicexedens]